MCILSVVITLTIVLGFVRDTYFPTNLELPPHQNNQYSITDDQILENVAEAKRDQERITNKKDDSVDDYLNEDAFVKFVEEKYDENQLDKYTTESFLYIDNEEMLQICAEFLENQDVIGIDIENHRQTSYEGFMCLLQVSGFSIPEQPKSFVIDVLAVRNVFKKHFGEKILQNKKIIKIFHGCIASDILWLQRDFGIQTLNVFDTQELARNYISQKQLSLAQFWSKYCDKLCLFQHDDKKQFQKADWSVRPLSKELLEYAAHDTYFLYHIAKQQIKEVKDVKGKNIKDLLSFYKKFNKKVTDAQYKLNVTTSMQQDSYRKLFRKQIDFYDPENDDYLLTELTFKQIFILREQIAQRLDINHNEIFQPNALYLISLKRPQSSTQLQEVLTDANIQMTWLVRTRLVRHFIPVIIQVGLNFQRDKIALIQYYKEQGQQSNISANAMQLRQQKKEERRKDVVKNFTCKKAVYEDGRMLAPDGNLLSYTDHKKAHWYVERGLATKVCSDPLTIKLNFEPSGRDSNPTNKAMNDDAFYCADRENACVRCGSTEDFSRFHIVPSLYRTHFPQTFKSHRSHDVVLLCFSCHEIANKKQETVKRKIAAQYQIPLHQVSEHFQVNIEINNLRKIAFSLIKGKLNIPPENRLKLQKDIVKYLIKIDESNALDQVIKDSSLVSEFKSIQHGYQNWTQPEQISDEMTLYLFRLKPLRLSNSQKLNPHGSSVIQKIMDEHQDSDEALADFIKMWRQHFLDSLQPRYMPEGWAVNHKIKREFGDFSRFKDVKERSLVENQAKTQKSH